LYRIDSKPATTATSLDCDRHPSKVDSIIQTNNQSGETLQSSIKSSDQTENAFARIIDRSADYIILVLDKLGDGIIYSFDKAASLPGLVGKIKK
ncbi:MAG TPA: hypothetical protein VJ488_05260, partial [Dehalococcoidia bacterium]|nr:hypothetical protein [Dehalococcoidia bacterium]